MFPLRSFADKAGVWYAEVLLPLALCPYVLNYALGGAMLSSSVMGGDKAGLSSPNDAWHGAAPRALIYGFPCQRRFAPLGSPTVFTQLTQLSQPSALISGFKHTHKNAHSIRCRNSDHHNVTACTQNWDVCRQSNNFPHRGVYFAVQQPQLLHCYTRSEAAHMKCYFRGVNVMSGCS